jgi:hypothetical protein
MTQKVAADTSRAEQEELGMDIALNVFSDDELCERYGLDASTLKRARALPLVREATLRVRRQLVDNGAEIRLHARARALEAIDTLSDLSKNEEIPSSARVRSAVAVVHFAGAEPKAQQVNQGVGITINTNLQLGNDLTKMQSEVYEVELLPAIVDDGEDLL